MYLKRFDITTYNKKREKENIVLMNNFFGMMVSVDLAS
jgi:hypothetical protein